MKNDLFNYLKRSNIFKDNGRYTYGGVSRILASEATEKKRADKLRLYGTPYSDKEWKKIQSKLTLRRKSDFIGENTKSKREFVVNVKEKS